MKNQYLFSGRPLWSPAFPVDSSVTDVRTKPTLFLPAYWLALFRCFSALLVGALVFCFLTGTVQAQTGEYLNFDGVNDAITATQQTTVKDNFTIEFWARPTATIDLPAQAVGGFDAIGGQRFAIFPVNGFGLGGAGAGVSIGTNGVCVVEHGAGYLPSLLTWAGTVSGWTHIVVVYTNKQPTLYINGALVATGVTSGQPNVFVTTTNYGGGQFGYFSGDMDELRIWDRSLTATEISSRTTTELVVGNETGLIDYYRFNQGMAAGANPGVTTLTDATSGNDGTLNNFALTGTASNWLAPSPFTRCTIVPSVVVTTNPGGTITAGTSVTFTAVPTNGGTTPTYTWKKGNITVGTNSETYVVATLKGGDVITCVLTPSPEICAAVGSATSNAITVPCPPRIYVTTTGTGTGSSWADAMSDLQAALDNGCGVTEIWVAKGTYKPTATSDQLIAFTLPSGIKLYGGFNGTEANLSERILAGNETILSGNIGDLGTNTDNSLNVMTIKNAAAGTLLDGIIFSDANGLGAVSINNSTVTVTNCTFRNNTSYNGGGLNFRNSSVTLSKCLFHTNTANNDGGAIHGEGTLVVSDCVFRSNTAKTAGGAFATGSATATFSNCLFYGNSSIGYYGSVIYSNATAILENCTVFSNNGNYGTIALENGAGTLKNCIVWGNSGSNPFSNNQPAVSYSIIQNVLPPGAGNVSADPLFVNAADPDGADNIFGTADDGLILTACSPALNKGDNSATTSTSDLAGQNRKFGVVDMGAYELQSAAGSLTIAITGSLTICAGQSTTLTASGGTGYNWSNGPTIAAISVSPTSTTAYSVTATSAASCSATATATVTVNPRPDAPVLTALPQTVYASNTPLSLTGYATATASNTLTFSSMGGVLNPPNATISQAGMQSFSVTQTNASGCTSLSTPFTITVLPSSPTSQTVCRSSAVVLPANGFGSRYEWYKNGTSAPFKLTEIASIQKGTATSSLTLGSIQTTANYYCKVFQANGSFVFTGPFAVVVNYSCIAPGARVAAAEVAEVPLSVVLTPNPIADGQLRAVVRGAAGQSLSVQLVDLRGQVVRAQQWAEAENEQVVDWNINQQSTGMYLLQAQTGNQIKTIKVIHR